MRKKPKKTNKQKKNSGYSTPGIYPEKNMIQKDIHTPVFIVALFTVVKTWKRPKCPSAETWIRKMWYIYTEE